MARAPRPSPDGESGAALAAVLVVVAVMSVLAISVVEAARFSTQRTGNQAQMDQTRWYLLGAEAYAIRRIDQAATATATEAVNPSDWLDRTLTLPLDNGSMQVTVASGDNCFNLNSLVRQEEGGPLVASEDGQARFSRLLALLGIGSHRTLAASLADWIDSDTVPGLGGAEDEAYGGGSAVALPANHLLGDASEMRSIAGFDASVTSRLARLACVRPTTSANVIAINTLRPDQAPLLAVIFGPALPLASAEALIRERPLGGWSTLDAFFADRRIAPIQLSDESRAMFTKLSRWYVIGIRVNFGDVTETSVALVDTAAGRGRVVRRVFGARVANNLL